MKIKPRRPRTWLTGCVFATTLIAAGCGSSDNDDDSTPTSRLRVIRASHDAPPVNLKLNGSVVLSGLDYASSSGFVDVTSGPTDIAVAAAIPGGNLDVINLDARASVEVESSETVLAVLIGNLIRNAVLYTREGEVDIEIDAGRLTIADSGPVIPEHGIEQLFEAFHRAGNENAAGQGIGLTIVKRLCDRFGWEIEIASRAQRSAAPVSA